MVFTPYDDMSLSPSLLPSSLPRLRYNQKQTEYNAIKWCIGLTLWNAQPPYNEKTLVK